MSNKTVSANELRKQSGKLLDAFNRELERVNQAKAQLTTLKQQFDKLKALNGTVVKEETTVSYGEKETTYTTVKTIVDVYITDGGMAEAFRRFNRCMAFFKSARAKLVTYCEAINESADEIEANNEAIIDALLGLGGSNVPVTNNSPFHPGGNNSPVIPSNNTPVVSGNNSPIVSGNNSPVIPSNNGATPTPSNNQIVPPNSNQAIPSNNQTVPPSNNQTPLGGSETPPGGSETPPGGGSEPPATQPRITEPTRTPTPTPTPTPTSTPTPTPTPTSTPTPTPTPTPTSTPTPTRTPTPTDTGYEPIPYTGISDDGKGRISNMAFPIGAAIAVAGVGAAIHEGMERYQEKKREHENHEFDSEMAEDIHSPITRDMPFTIGAAVATANAGQAIEESLKRKKDE